MSKPVQNKEEIIDRLRAARRELAALGVTELGLFGSFVIGQQGPASDVDMLVTFAPSQHTFDNFMELSFLLDCWGAPWSW